MGSRPHTPGWLALALGPRGPRAAPMSHCPLDLGCQADCEVPLGVGGWALAALWILQAPPQPALSLSPPQLQAGQDSGLPSVLPDSRSPPSAGMLSVWTPSLLHYTQCSFPGSLDEADLSIGFCPPSARCCFVFWAVGGPTVGLEGVRGPGHAPARAGGGLGPRVAWLGWIPLWTPGVSSVQDSYCQERG